MPFLANVETSRPRTIFPIGSLCKLVGEVLYTITGSIDPAASVSVVGVGTKFTEELTIGQSIVVSAETRIIDSITDDTHLTVTVAFSNNANDTSPDAYPLIASFWTESGTSPAIVVDHNGLLTGTVGPLVATVTKLGLFGATPVVQPSTTGEATGYTGAAGTALTHTDTFTGNSGTKAYTINDIVKHLKAVGILTGS